MKQRVALVLGTRPEAIKMAPLIRGFGFHQDFEPIVISTGQHREMLDQALRGFGIQPDIDLGVRRNSQSLAELTSAVLAGLDEALERVRPHTVIAHGDTTTTLGAGLAAFYRKVPLVHVEAGLRSGNKWAPYPEEFNRRVTALAANLHLAPTAQARQNLLDEGVDPATVVVTGNTVIDAMHATLGRAGSWPDPSTAVLDSDPRRVLLLTIHRRESWGATMMAIAQTVTEVADRHPDMLVVACLHANPAVQAMLLPVLGGRGNVITIAPQPYPIFLKLIQRAYLVVTDSGGVQEECIGLGKPLLVLRDVTERHEGIAAGGARLVGTDPDRVRSDIELLWNDRALFEQMASAANPYGDGRATARCVAAVARMLGLSDEPVSEFDLTTTAKEATGAQI